MLVYDRWGHYGRPVLLLHGLGFDRTMWWPTAAELAAATTCTVIAPDLPGHGDSPARPDPAQLVHRLDLHRAPIVVGHAESAALATTFGERYAAHEVLKTDDLGNGGTEIPEHFRPYAQPSTDPSLLTAYEEWPPQTPSWPHLTDPRGFAADLLARLTAKR
jgi:pimeloyl-ACP methyl ester carboxylesterase